jgi:hypothetical protein
MRRCALALLLAGCGPRTAPLDQAERFLAAGRYVDARNSFHDEARTKDEPLRARALLGAARAELLLRDRHAARLDLERAAPLHAGDDLLAKIYFELAGVLVADGERPRAEHYFYLAAGSARATGQTAIYERASAQLAHIAQ